MKYSRKGHKDRKRHKNRIKRSGQARLVYVRHKPQHPHHVHVSPQEPLTQSPCHIAKSYKHIHFAVDTYSQTDWVICTATPLFFFFFFNFLRKSLSVKNNQVYNIPSGRISTAVSELKNNFTALHSEECTLCSTLVSPLCLLDHLPPTPTHPLQTRGGGVGGSQLVSQLVLRAQSTTKDYIRAEHKLHSISKLVISQVTIPQNHRFLAYLYTAGTQHGNLHPEG